jgi:hypothetical protein
LIIYCWHWQYPARTQNIVKKKGDNKDSRKGGLSVGREDPGEEVDGRYRRSKKPVECLAGYIWISEEVSVPVLAQQTATAKLTSKSEGLPKRFGYASGWSIAPTETSGSESLCSSSRSSRLVRL